MTAQTTENAARLLEIRADLPGLPAPRRGLVVGKLLRLATFLATAHGEAAAFDFLRFVLSTVRVEGNA